MRSAIISWIFLVLAHNALATCPPGSVQSLDGRSCFLYVAKPASWSKALVSCLTKQGNLASIPSALTNAYTASLVGISGADSVWLGGAGSDEAPWTWTWSDGARFSYTNWERGQPKNVMNQCLAFHPSGKWSSEDCNSRKPYMCKLPSTGGGEQATTTAPAPFTTTSLPSVSVPSCWSGWQYISMTNTCYYVTSDFTKDNWTDARSLCETKYGGHLASIPSAEANSRIINYALGQVNLLPPFAFFIGLRTNSANPMLGKWYWTDGSPVSFVQWGGTPPSAYMNFDCVWSDTSGTWRNDLCDSSGYGNGPYFAICEREPDFA